MNARAYRHHTGISRMMVINAACTMLAIAGMAYAIVWPALSYLSELGRTLGSIGAIH